MSTPITCPHCAASFPTPNASVATCPQCHALVPLGAPPAAKPAPPAKQVVPPPFRNAATLQAQAPLPAPSRKSSGVGIALAVVAVLGGGMFALLLLCGVGGLFFYQRAAVNERVAAETYGKSATIDYSTYAPSPSYTPESAPYVEPAYAPPAPVYTDPAYVSPPVYTEPSYAPPVITEPSYTPPAPAYDNSARIAELQTAIAQAEAELQYIDGRITLGTVSEEAGGFAEGQSESIGQALLLRLLTKAAEVGKQEWEKERAVVQARLDAYRAELQQLQSATLIPPLRKFRWGRRSDRGVPDLY